MDFFGFGSSDFNTPVGALIKSATDPLLLGPDWAKNIEICDMINGNKEGVEAALKALTRRLQDSDPKVVNLSLSIAETCMKNCGQIFASSISKPFMDEMIHIARGSKGPRNQDEALKLIQQWGKQYQRNRQLGFFYEVYEALRRRGAAFPPDDTAVPENSIRPNPGNTESSDRNFANTNEDEITKLRNDINEVFDKVRLCREMLVESPGIANDEALAEVIGYLEACRDRMVDLVDAGTQGLLGEDMFGLCLRANDAILKTLEAEKNNTPIEIEDGLLPPEPMKSNNPTPTTATATSATIASSPSPYTNSSISGSGNASSSSGLSTGTTSKSGGSSALQANLLDDNDNDEFAGLTLKTARRVGGGGAGGGTSSVTKSSRSIAPPPSQSTLQVPILPPPPPTASAASTSVNLIALEDLLSGPTTSATTSSTSMNPFLAAMTSPPVAAAPAPAPAFGSSSDIDIFLNAPEYSSIPSSAPPAGSASASTIPASQMNENDFEDFLSSLNTTK